MKSKTKGIHCKNLNKKESDICGSVLFKLLKTHEKRHYAHKDNLLKYLKTLTQPNFESPLTNPCFAFVKYAENLFIFMNDYINMKNLMYKNKYFVSFCHSKIESTYLKQYWYGFIYPVFSHLGIYISEHIDLYEAISIHLINVLIGDFLDSNEIRPKTRSLEPRISDARERDHLYDQFLGERTPNLSDFSIRSDLGLDDDITRDFNHGNSFNNWLDDLSWTNIVNESEMMEEDFIPTDDEVGSFDHLFQHQTNAEERFPESSCSTNVIAAQSSNAQQTPSIAEMPTESNKRPAASHSNKLTKKQKRGEMGKELPLKSSAGHILNVHLVNDIEFVCLKVVSYQFQFYIIYRHGKVQHKKGISPDINIRALFFVRTSSNSCFLI